MARSLKGIALVVTLGTLLSKFGGLIRQLVIAAAFGVGAAYDAYNYAYVLPVSAHPARRNQRALPQRHGERA